MALSNFIKNNKKEARKLFGKKEIEIIIKQLSGKKLTQTERNVLSRDIKKKLKFIKKVSKFQDEFDLKHNQDNKVIINKAVSEILNHKLKKKIKAILLFGSFADNTFTFRSDIDICVVFNENISLKKATLFRIDVLGELPDKVDIQVFNTLPQKLKRSIAKNHKVLYETSDYDNVDFTIKHIKNRDYFVRMKKIFGET